MMFPLTETRYEIALKVFHWSPAVADLSRVASELAVSSYEFNKMSDEEFIQLLFFYVHNQDTSICS